MPQNKDLKRLVRSRMQKTGESYTAARTQLTKKKTRIKAGASIAAKDVVLPVGYEKLAGYTDKTIAAKTGCAWEKWVYVLDKWGAMDKSHTATAAYVSTQYKIDGWWAQAVTVGYERIKGLRARGQRLSGVWEATKSKTFNVPVEELFDAWANAKTRKRWLPEKLTVRKATKNRSIRITWADDTSVEVWFQAKGEKSIAGVQHVKLASKADQDARKRYWAERLAALNELLTG